jgi:hypothetical protein
MLNNGVKSWRETKRGRVRGIESRARRSEDERGEGGDEVIESWSNGREE